MVEEEEEKEDDRRGRKEDLSCLYGGGTFWQETHYSCLIFLYFNYTTNVSVAMSKQEKGRCKMEEELHYFNAISRK